jgi:hypothetical protein
MIFPRKKLILPCHKNGYLQSASDARKYRDRFKRNPLAKVADMFVPKPMRMSPGYPCCCEVCTDFPCGGDLPDQIELTFDGITNDTCSECIDLNGTYILDYCPECFNGPYEWRYTASLPCGGSYCYFWILRLGPGDCPARYGAGFNAAFPYGWSVTYSKQFTNSRPPCSKINNMDIPIYDNILCGSGGTCTATGIWA